MKRLLALALLLAGCAPPGPELKLLTWPDYFAKDTIAAFEKEAGCRVKVDYIENSETLRTKLEGGTSGYDVVFPSDEVVAFLVEKGLLETLELSKLPNLKNIDARYKGLPFDPQNAHSVPYMTGSTGIAYHVDKVKPAPDSWAAVLKADVGLLDDAREVFAAALRVEGAGWDVDGLRKASKRLEGWTPKVWDSSPRQRLAAGDVVIAQCFSGDALQASESLKGKIGYVIPKEGGTLWIDNLCIAKGAPRKDLAHRFIDYLLRAEVSAAITNECRFGNPNEAARSGIRKELLENPLIFPKDEELKRLALLPSLSGGLKKALDQAWAALKAR